MKFIRQIQERDALPDLFTELREIKTRCSDFIQANALLLRGTGAQSKGDLLTDFPIRTDRKPRDADPETSNLYNLLIEFKHDISRIRAKSLYATTRHSSAAHYHENVYIVFPTNGSQYAFHSRISDTKPYTEHAVSDIYDEFNSMKKGAAGTLVRFLNKPIVTIDEMKKDSGLYDRFVHALHILGQDPDSSVSTIFGTTITSDPFELAVLNHTAHRSSFPVEVAIFGQPTVYAIPYGMPITQDAFKALGTPITSYTTEGFYKTYCEFLGKLRKM